MSTATASPAAKSARERRRSGGSGIHSVKKAQLVALELRRMVIDGELRDGEYLPTQLVLQNQLGVSRATLREAIRLLEADQLLEVRPGSRSGPRVRVPGREIVVRPAELLLEMSHATIADIMVARRELEPAAASLLAEVGTPSDFDELERLISAEMHAAWREGRLADFAETFHRRIVELTGNAPLTVVASLLQEISTRHTMDVLKQRRKITRAEYLALAGSYTELMRLLRTGDRDGTAAHWREHLNMFNDVVLHGFNRLRVRDAAH
ncbi:MAG TPA: FCD domain-containing protein [Mycobacterium sp.]|nr:FCD domain-containing protein [Mycobacterium sp.]